MNLTSLQNDKVKYWVSLGEKKTRDKDKCFLVEGNHLINEAKKQNLIVETISVVNKNADYYVTEDIMRKISKQQSISLEAAVVKFIPEDSISGNVLILDGIQDPGNLGTIIRSSVAFNFYTLILGDTCVDLYNPKVIRATEGMIFNLNILRRNLKDFIPTLKNLGYKIVGSLVTDGKSARELKKDNIALVIGSEGQGISPEVKDLCDEFIHILMEEDCESLNAGVAASILMYEVYHE